MSYQLKISYSSSFAQKYPDIVKKDDNPRDHSFDKIERYYSAGTHYLVSSCGTVPVFNLFAGFSLHAELSMLTMIGLTPREAIAAATGNIREIWNWKNIGAITPGNYADLLVLEEDPIKDLKNLQKIKKIYLNGKEIDRQSLLECKNPQRK